MNASSGIFAGCIDGALWLRVEGKGNFQNSPDLKTFVGEKIRDGLRRLIIDLRQCTGMDSTFMGMLACTASRLEEANGCLHVINAAGRNGDSLRGLGLDQLFTVDDATEHLSAAEACGCQMVEEEEKTAAVAKCGAGKKEQTGVCLEAHEALAACDGRNQSRFRDVIELMRGELARAGA